MILGYDAAKHYQKELDYEALKNKGGKFIIIKAGEGHLDYKSQDYVLLAKDNGLLTGTYWYYRQVISWGGKDVWCEPKKQAQMYFEATKNNQDLPPALDIENTGNPYFRAGDILTCLLEIEKLFGKKPIIYTGKFIWEDKVKSPSWSVNYPLWLAQYRATELIELPKPFTKWKIHQFSDQIKVSGTTIDHNYFNGDMLDLLDFCNLGELEPPIARHRVIVLDCGKPGGGWLYFRNRPELYDGAMYALGTGEILELLEPDKVQGDIEYWHVKGDNREGYISAGSIYTRLI